LELLAPEGTGRPPVASGNQPFMHYPDMTTSFLALVSLVL